MLVLEEGCTVRTRGRHVPAKRIALQRISKLMEAARDELERNPDRSRRYVQLARAISTRCKVRIPRLRRKICRRCNTLMIPGKTFRVRIRKGRAIYTCMSCGRVYRFPIR